MTDLRLGDLYTGKLVRLAAPLAEDRETFARWTNDAEYMRLLDDEPVRPRHPDFFAEFFPPKREWEGTSVNFHLRTLTDDRLIGFVALWNIIWSARAGTLSIGIGDPDYRGRGFGSDALRLMLGYAFREMNLNRIGLYVLSYNTRAIRAYEKAGFVREGAQREAHYREGRYHDMILMSILQREWNPGT